MINRIPPNHIREKQKTLYILLGVSRKICYSIKFISQVYKHKYFFFAVIINLELLEILQDKSLCHFFSDEDINGCKQLF